jgi:hypothetical protein
MRRLPTTLLWLLCCAALSSGCASSPALPRLFTETRIERPQVPAALLTCSDAPALPGEASTQRTVASYIADLAGAWEDCRAKLAAVGKLLAAEGK